MTAQETYFKAVSLLTYESCQKSEKYIALFYMLTHRHKRFVDSQQTNSKVLISLPFRLDRRGPITRLDHNNGYSWACNNLHLEHKHNRTTFY